MIDLSKHFDWRDGARRAVFVLGDEGMEGGGGILTNAAKIKMTKRLLLPNEKKSKYIPTKEHQMIVQRTSIVSQVWLIEIA